MHIGNSHAADILLIMDAFFFKRNKMEIRISVANLVPRVIVSETGELIFLVCSTADI